jgi:SAM-dependent methyltransferase
MQKQEYAVMYTVEDAHWWFAARRLFLEEILGRPTKKKLTIIDIGAGTGGTTNWLKRYGKVVGIEPSAVGRTFAKKRGVMLQAGTAHKTGLPAGSADLVTILDVLYHREVLEKRAIVEAYRVLAPGGFLLITDCALPFLAGPHDRAVFGKRRYMLSDMTSLVLEGGFGITRATYTFFLVFPATLIRRILYKKNRTTHSDVFMPPQFVNRFFLWLCRIEAQLLRWCRLPWGSSVLVYAQKPYRA